MSMAAQIRINKPLVINPVALPAHSGLLQRKCACGGTPGADGECAECRKKKLTVQRKAINGSLPPLDSPETNYGQRSQVQQVGHDFSHVRVSTALPGKIQTKLTINEPGDKYEQEADRVADTITAKTGPTEQRSQFVLHQIRPAIQRDDRLPEIGVHSKKFYTPYMDYKFFIENAEKYGLPVGLLKRVGNSSYAFDTGSDEEANVAFNTITLSEDTLTEVRDLSPTSKKSSMHGIHVIYHESTHAYLDLLSDEPKFKQFIKAGEQHYKEAPLKEGGKTTDPSRVFQEAAAGYVADHVSFWWQAYSLLAWHIAHRNLTRKNIEKIKQDYNKAMAEKVHGYSSEGGHVWGLIGGTQKETARPLSPEMIVFLNHELLEDKIPDQFDSVESFRRMINEAYIKPDEPVSPGSKKGGKVMPERLPGSNVSVGDIDADLSIMRSSGEPLSTPARAFFEPRFGHDFSKVRVHTDARAAESAKAINARAYTLGRDVVFGAGQYAPETREGKRLLAHELTHVVQQNTATPKMINDTGSPTSSSEHEASLIAESVGQDAPKQPRVAVPLSSPLPGFVQRQSDAGVSDDSDSLDAGDASVTDDSDTALDGGSLPGGVPGSPDDSTISNTPSCQPAYDTSYGPSPANCAPYQSSLAQKWLTYTYRSNATCACQRTPDNPKNNCVRKCLQTKLSGLLSRLSSSGAAPYSPGFSSLLPEPNCSSIYDDHVDCYKACCCTEPFINYPTFLTMCELPFTCSFVGTTIDWFNNCY